MRVPWAENPSPTLDQIAQACRGRISRVDGIRAEYDHGWALVRASITEPALTFRFEGSSYEAMRAIANSFLAPVPELRQKILEMIDE
jgi:phosphomannomutase/phosphoglucomutase